MDRRNDSTPLYDWPGSSDGQPDTASRWTLVSTSLSALIVSSVAWLAIATMPPVTAVGTENANHGFLPYRLFQELTQSGNALFASTASLPGTSGTQPTQLDDALAAERANAQPENETHTVTLEPGDTLVGALEDVGISQEDSNSAVAALATVFSPRSVRAGQMFDLTYSVQPITDADITSSAADGRDLSEPVSRLISIKFSPSVDHDIVVNRAADGNFAATDTVKQLVPHVHRAGATIDSSLYLSAMHAGIPADVVVEMIRMFSYKVDFQRDLHPGDSFEVFYDYYYTAEGQPAKQGNISYAMMRLGGREISLYRYQSDPNQPAEYFDSKGQSAKGMLMKPPVDGARLTSGFGMRYHPVLGYTRMHKGVDFGVPVGTPVMAAGAGTVAYAGWEGGYGRFVLINNGNGYSTAYGHLSRFAAGLHRGSRVRQAQVIAFSGNTGITTGPHLHYEIRVNNVQVNPLKVKMAQGRKLVGREARAFQIERMHVDDKLASTKLETRIADASSVLRQGN